MNKDFLVLFFKKEQAFLCLFKRRVKSNAS